MCRSSISWYLKIFQLSMLCIATNIVILLVPTGAVFAHSFTGNPNISIAPVFSDPANNLTRAYFIFNGQPGAQQSNSIRVTNVGTGRGTVILYAVDAITGQSSGTTFLNRTDARHDVGAWIGLSRTQVTLDPGSSEVVPFHIVIPLAVRPGQHAGGIIAEISTQSLATSVRLQHRVALGVLVNLPGPTSQRLEATSVGYDETNAYQRLLVALHNTGTQLLHPHGTLQISNVQDHPVQNFWLTLDTFIPQTSIDYPVYVQHPLAVGTYRATLRLFYEQNHVLLYTTTFVIQAPSVIHPTKTFSGIVNPLALNSSTTFSSSSYILVILCLLLAGSGIYFWGKKLYAVAKRRGKKSK